MTASRQPVRPVSVPRSVVRPTQLRSLCVTGCPGNADASPSLHAHDVPPFSIAGSPAVPVHHPRLASECLLCLTGTPEPFSAPRRTIFCAGHDGELCVVSPPSPAPVPPRRIAMRCSRGGTEESSHGFERRGWSGRRFFQGALFWGLTPHQVRPSNRLRLLGTSYPLPQGER